MVLYFGPGDLAATARASKPFSAAMLYDGAVSPVTPPIDMCCSVRYVPGPGALVAKEFLASPNRSAVWEPLPCCTTTDLESSSPTFGATPERLADLIV